MRKRGKKEVKEEKRDRSRRKIRKEKVSDKERKRQGIGGEKKI